MNGKIKAEQLNIWIEWTETRMIVHKNLNCDLNVIQVFIDSILLFTQAISNDLICISRYCVNKNQTPFKWIELKDFGNKYQASLWCVCHGCVCECAASLNSGMHVSVMSGLAIDSDYTVMLSILSNGNSWLLKIAKKSLVRSRTNTPQ